MRYLLQILFFLLFISSSYTYSQSPANLSCPPNIGFESGTLDFWNCAAGVINRDGTLRLVPTGPLFNRHTILMNSYPQEMDPYGNFPVNCPNGSGYSLRLGNDVAGGQAESISYTFTIPDGQNDYSILYNYAVVFQNPPHQPWEQPKFQSRIYNVTDNKYINCGSFEFIASGNLPGFQLSPIGTNVFYKPWSPVTVNLSGLAGKTVRLEFFTNDCAYTQHFGYAYLDVNEDCSSGPISGNVYCGGAQSITLTAPFGFASYSWYNEDFSQLLGQQNTLVISPVPPPNTKYAVVILPYDGVGCKDTLYTTVRFSNEPFTLNVIPEITGCKTTGVNLTSAVLTAGSTPGLVYSYYTDVSQLNYVPVPSKVTASGIYYIKGVNKSGCNDIKPIKVTIIDPPVLVIKDPDGVCMPQKVNITLPEITTGSEPGLTLTYWQNIDTTILLTNPGAIDKSGIYYIKAIKAGSCAIVKPVVVKIGEIPNVVIHHPAGCGKVNLADTLIYSGSTSNLTYTYWTNAAATNAVTDLIIKQSGTFYIKASFPSGCSIIRPVVVTVNPIPDFTVTDPAPVVYPIQIIDITAAVSHTNGLKYTYWLDSLTRRPVANPAAITKRGRYFIRATNEFGCSTVKPVNAVIIPPPQPIVYAPNAFTPNNDGLNDVFTIKVIGEVSIGYLKIYNRWGQLVYANPDLLFTWNGRVRGIDLPVGSYVWVLAGMDTYFKKPFTQKGVINLLR